MGEESLDKNLSKQTRSSEADKLPPVVFIYRENDLFKKWIPIMKSNLKAMNRDVEIHEFPRGTEEEEIEKWLTENYKENRGKKVFFDGTVGNAATKLYWKEENEGDERIEYDRADLFIDSVLTDNATKILFGKDEPRELQDEINKAGSFEKALDMTEKSFVIMIKKILETQKPENIIVFLSHVSDHAPFDYLKLGRPNLFDEIDEDYQIAEEQIKKWLVGGGIDQEKIVFSTEKDPQKIKDTIEKTKGGPENWIIFDRHFLDGIEGEVGTIKINSTKLQLPMANFLQDAIDSGLLQIESSEINIKQSLKELFSVKAKEE